MPIRVEREEGAALDEALAALLPVEPYLAYANFAPIGANAVRLHERRWRAAAAAGGALVARDGGRPLASLYLQRRAFESEHFGMAMAKAEAAAAIAPEELRLEALRALYRAACDLARQDGIAHLAASAPTQDRVACWVLQEIGAFHVGTRISWMQALTGERQPQDLQPGLRFESYDKASIPQLQRPTWQRLLEWTGKAFDRGPYVFDLNVPAERARAIYQVWTEKALTGEWADFLLVVRDGSEIVAYHTMQWIDDLSEAAGVGILSRGIGGTLPEYSGLFSALQKECAAVRPLGASFLENETQAASIPVINVFGKLGHQCFRSTASFHLRLDGGAKRSAGAR